MMPSTPTFSNPISEDDFAIVFDRERRFIVDCGSYPDMRERAHELNMMYQSNAYSAQRWIEGRIW